MMERKGLGANRAEMMELINSDFDSNRGVEQRQQSAESGKAAALALYNFEVLPLSSVTRLFRAHPNWRAA